LIIANKELAFQNEEKEKRAAELIHCQQRVAAFTLYFKPRFAGAPAQNTNLRYHYTRERRQKPVGKWQI